MGKGSVQPGRIRTRLVWVLLWSFLASACGLVPAVAQTIVPLLSFTNEWRYEQSGTDPETLSYRLGFRTEIANMNNPFISTNFDPFRLFRLRKN